MRPDRLVAGICPDEVRGSLDALREAVALVAERGERQWTGPWPSYVEGLRAVGAVDLCLARLVEGHADARRILSQAPAVPRPGTYGVWASRSVGTGLTATRDDRGHRVHGEVRFASGVDVVDRVLVPAITHDGEQLLLDVPAERFRPDRSGWVAPGMDASRSFTTHLDTVVGPEDVVGPPGFYLDRPGFLLGGLGPAAVWAGGLRGLARTVAAGLARFAPTPHQLRRLGVLEQRAWEAGLAVDAVAAGIEAADDLRAVAGQVARARTAVVTACDAGLDEVGRIVGPGGLTTDARLARTLADLALYVRQHHLDAEAERAGTAAVTAARRVR